MPDRLGYNIFGSQILRFYRICNNFDLLKIKILQLFDICINLGYNNCKLISTYHNLIRKHGLAINFTDISKIL